MFWKIIRRVVTVLPAIVIQVIWIVMLTTWLNPWSAWIETALRILSALFLLYIITYRQEATYRIQWILFILTAPVPAAICYILWGNGRTTRLLRLMLRNSLSRLPKANAGIDYTSEFDDRMASSISCVSNLSGFPVTKCESVKYYPSGELYWQDMLTELEKAEKYIFIEFFIVQDGIMWQSVRNILAEKAKMGVDVRLIYDDVGSIATFSRRDTKKLDDLGIKWFSFNPLRFVAGTLNNRTHRKMVIIDGKTAFSGGINLADEYINKRTPYGHWKDIGFKLTGPGVQNYLRMFTQFWNAFSPDKIHNEVFDDDSVPAKNADGYVLSYFDSPGTEDPISNNFYIEMLGNSVKNAWFYTPYLMLDDTLMDAFVRAAKRGVDVKIIMPGIPDKKLVYRMSRSYYLPLLEAGVKIYEYEPGFIHAKASLFDDKLCTIGTVNLDYRSLFMHFENNSIFVNSSVIKDLKQDYEKTLEKCKEVEPAKQHLITMIVDGILRLFSPLC